MLIDVISPIIFAADLLSVGSPVDAVLTHRPQQKIAIPFPNPPFVRLIEGEIDRLPERSVSLEAEQQKVQRAVLLSRRNELVQDRDAGNVWPALACSFLLVGQPCQR